MNVEVHVDWRGRTHLVGCLYPAGRSMAVSFEYDASWLDCNDRFAIDPVSLPLRRGLQHGAALFGAVQDCGPDRWGRLLIARAVRKKVLVQKPFGDEVSADLRELWRRLAFSLLVSNYDDHLRNHGFLMHAAGRWSLSPAYDLNPVPEIDRAQAQETPIAEDQDEPTMAGAIRAAPRFGLKTDEAKTILRAVSAAVSRWRETGLKLRLKAATLDAYESAFEHPLREEASRLLGQP